jgi:signal transduction histidine kinase
MEKLSLNGAMTLAWLSGVGLDDDRAVKRTVSARGRRQMDKVLGTAPMLLFVMDRAGNMTFLEAQRQVLGIDPLLSAGKPVDECFEQAPEIVERLRSAVAGEPFSGVIRVAQSGSFIDLTCHPQHGPDGAVTGVSGVMIDATGRVRAEEARRRSEARSLLIATMNHEARTPLNAILGFTELLGSGRQGELNEDQRRYVANIDLAGRQLLSLVSDASDLSRMKSGSMVLSPTNLGVASVINGAIEQLESLAARSGVRLKASCPAELTVNADHARLLQVLWSLASNAIHFTPDGGSVSISARPAGRFTHIDVADTGPGIPADRLSRINLEFTEAGSLDAGSGMGLAMTRQLIALMGGRVTVTSKLGVGTTFCLQLPGFV